jgi:hypothetical protein
MHRDKNENDVVHKNTNDEKKKNQPKKENDVVLKL